MREVGQHSAVKTEEQDAEFQRLFENDEVISEALQKTVQLQAAELEELRTLRHKYLEQARELEELRKKVMTSPSEESKHGEWVQQPCRHDRLDARQALVDFVRPWTNSEPDGSALQEPTASHVEEIVLEAGHANAIVRDHRKRAFIVPHCLSALKKIHGLHNTCIFYYRDFKELRVHGTTLFEDNIGHVVIVLPPVEPLTRSWIPMVRAVSMWMAIGCIVYLVAGPRTIDDDAWYRVAAQARNHINSFVHAHPQYQGQLVDKLPTVAGAAYRGFPSFAIGALETQDDVIPERNARLFYTVCARQLAHLVTLEPLPSKGVRTQGVNQSYPPVKEGRIEKRRLRKQAQKLKKKIASAPCPAMP